MVQKFYLDTGIWRDYYEDRRDNMRPLGEFAFNFLRACLEKKIPVLVSDAVVIELRRYFPQEKVDEIFSFFKGIIVNMTVTPEQYSEARKELAKRLKVGNKLPFDDVLHAVVAKHHGAVLIARDNDFDFLHEIVEIEKPEDVTLGGFQTFSRNV